MTLFNPFSYASGWMPAFLTEKKEEIKWYP